jgi:hypothetical protein
MTVDAINSLAILGKEIKIQLVCGHNRTIGNDKADLMAKEGATMASLGPEPFLPYAKILCKQETKLILLKRWTAKWQKSIDYRQTRIFFPLPDASVSKNLLHLSRKHLGLIIRHGNGHSNLNYHQSKQQPGLSPLCHLCGEKAEESHHIILSCPALCRTRQDWLWQPVQSIAWYTLGLLNFLSQPQVAKLEDRDQPIVSNTGPELSQNSTQLATQQPPNRTPSLISREE